MKNVIILGYEYDGILLYEKIKDGDYNILGFADVSQYKNGMKVDTMPIYSIDDLILLRKQLGFSVIMVSSKYNKVASKLVKNDIKVEGIWLKGDVRNFNSLNGILLYLKMIKNDLKKLILKKCRFKAATFEKLDLKRDIKFYAGDVTYREQLDDLNLYGLSINKADKKHISHDITKPYPLPDNCIISYQAEDVLEHIPMDKLVFTINEIYRILKPGAIFRISLPDYYSHYLKQILMINDKGEIVFDARGGGSYGKNGVEDGGHLWFPNYHNVQEILEQTKFNNYEFLCYRTEDGVLHKKDIDFTKGQIKRVYRKTEDAITSMVIDCYK